MKISALFGKWFTAFILMGLALSSTAEVNDKAPCGQDFTSFAIEFNVCAIGHAFVD